MAHMDVGQNPVPPVNLKVDGHPKNTTWLSRFWPIPILDSSHQNQFKSHFLPAMIFGRISNMFWGLEDMRNAVTRFDYFISEQANIEAFAFWVHDFSPVWWPWCKRSCGKVGFVSRLRWPVGVNGKHSSALFNSDSPRESHLNCLGPLVFPQSSDNPVWVRFCWLCIHRSVLNVYRQNPSIAGLGLSPTGVPKIPI